MNESIQFPGAEPGDPEDVTWTLQTAGAMWARGDHHEAVRWLRRAAEAAEEGGNDLRAVSLARAAADLTSALALPPSVLPPPPAATPDETSRMAPLPVSRPDNPPIQPLDDADGAFAESDYTIPEMSAVASPPARPPPPPRSRPNHPPPSRPAPSSPAHPPPSRPASSRPSAAPAALAIRQRQALRVAVEPSPTDKSSLVVRVLAEDESVPAGAHEAILTALEPGAHLLSRKR